MAIITTPLPYIFSNGTTADATQVNADLNQIVSGVNTNAAPLSNPTFPTGVTVTAGTTTFGSGSGVFLNGSVTLSGGAVSCASPVTYSGLGIVTSTAQPAFHAYRSTNQTSGSTIIYDTVTSQQGGTNYSNSTGSFTAPNTGWYLFCVAGNFLYSSNPADIVIGIYVNGSVYASTYTQNQGGNGYYGYGISTVAYMSAGQTAQVTAVLNGPFDSTKTVYGAAGTSFSGAQLF